MKAQFDHVYTALQLNTHLLHLLIWVIFALTYIGLAIGEIPRMASDRTAIVVLGAAAMLLVGALTLRQATNSIDYPTILLLFGLMIFSGQLHLAGFYDVVGKGLIHLSRWPRYLLACLILVTAVLSALLANDIVCLAFTPLLCAALVPAGRNPVPYLLALATSANIGSAATLIGNPQNMYIGSVAHLAFASYLLTMLIPVAIGLMICYAAVLIIFHRELAASVIPAQSSDPRADPDWATIIKTLILLSLLIAYFLIARGPSAAAHRAIAALAGGALLLISAKSGAIGIYKKFDYKLILLFLGLFVVNGAMSVQGLTSQLFSAISAAHVDLNRPFALAGVTTILSNIISNVPAVLLLAPAVQASSQHAHSVRNWYLLALVSTWAGNLTLVGSIANLIVAEGAKSFGVKISLGTYCKLGVPLTVLTVLVGVAWLALIIFG